jgi:hypothetical protein
MADKVHISRAALGPASAPSDERTSHQFGLTAAMALIVGSFIGVGALCPRHDRRRTVAGVFDLVHRVLAQHRTQLLGLLGAVFLADGALLLGIPVYLGQRRHMSQPAPVPPYREVERGG